MTKKPSYFLTFAEELRGETEEKIAILLFKKRKKTLFKKIILSGSISQIRLTAKMIFAPALLSDCKRIVLIHNHPSGKVFPSERDYVTTTLIAEGAILLDLQLFEHLIVTKDDYFSFREAGIL